LPSLGCSNLVFFVYHMGYFACDRLTIVDD
jgi:hypothetical protein